MPRYHTKSTGAAVRVVGSRVASVGCADSTPQRNVVSPYEEMIEENLSTKRKRFG